MEMPWKRWPDVLAMRKTLTYWGADPDCPACEGAGYGTFVRNGEKWYDNRTLCPRCLPGHRVEVGGRTYADADRVPGEGIRWETTR